MTLHFRPTFLVFSLLIYMCAALAAQTQTVRLKAVPLVEDVEGEKKQFKFDFRSFIPDGGGKETKIYLVSRFCYNGQNFIVRKTVASPKFTFTVKYYVDQFLDERPIFAASKMNSRGLFKGENCKAGGWLGYEGLTYCVGEFKIEKLSLMRCNPLDEQAANAPERHLL